jgi:hypothetical protein
MGGPDEFLEQLRELPRDARGTVALRAAMRVFPIFALREQDRRRAFAYWRDTEAERHVLAILQCYQTSTFGNSLPKADADAIHVEAAIRAAAARADAAVRAAAPIHFAAIRAADAARAATRAAAIHAADAAIYIADADARAAVHAALKADLDSARNEAAELLQRGLWRQAIPSGFSELWRDLRRDLMSLDSSFEVWIDWYEGRLAGRPLDLKLERQWVLLPEYILARSPAEINAHLRALRDGRKTRDEKTGFPDRASEDAPPELPCEQQPGLQFAIRADGMIDLRPSGLAPLDDLAEIRAMRGAMIEALDDLTALLDGSNAYGTIARVAMRYKAAISADELSIDALYTRGIRLENARVQLEREIASKDYPDIAPAAGEALASVVALHGPTIYSTARGRELIEKARAYAKPNIDLAAYKPAAERVAQAIGKADAIMAETVREIVPELAHDIGEGPHPERSTQVGHTTISNVLTAAAKGVQKAICSEAVQKSVEDGVKDGVKKMATAAVVAIPTLATGAVAAGVCSSAPTIAAFLLANQAILCDFALLAGADLSWLPPFLHWLKRQQHRLNG